LIKTDIVTVNVALGATAKVTIVFLPTTGVSRRGSAGEKEACPSIGKTPNHILILPTLSLFLDACNIKKLLYEGSGYHDICIMKCYPET
jgi:hypothetical protein